MIYHILHETRSERYAALAELVRRKAPLFMRAGGVIDATRRKDIKFVTPEIAARIKALTLQHWTAPDIAVELDLHVQTVSRWRAKLGLSHNPASKRLGPEKLARLWQLHAAGWSRAAIGRELGCTHRAVGWRLMKGTGAPAAAA